MFTALCVCVCILIMFFFFFLFFDFFIITIIISLNYLILFSLFHLYFVVVVVFILSCCLMLKSPGLMFKSDCWLLFSRLMFCSVLSPLASRRMALVEHHCAVAYAHWLHPDLSLQRMSWFCGLVRILAMLNELEIIN